MPPSAGAVLLVIMGRRFSINDDSLFSTVTPLNAFMSASDAEVAMPWENLAPRLALVTKFRRSFLVKGVLLVTKGFWRVFTMLLHILARSVFSSLRFVSSSSPDSRM